MHVFPLKSVLAVAFAAGMTMAVLAPQTAGAASYPPDVKSGRLVWFPDLDLSKREDAKVLHQRIDRAARVICRAEFDIRSVSMHAAFKACVAKAIDIAVGRVGDVNLTAVHKGVGPALASR